MLPRPKRYALIKHSHFALGFAETSGAGLQTPPRFKAVYKTQRDMDKKRQSAKNAPCD
jgi:hypothetical protein